MFDSTDLVEYHGATRLAAAYRTGVARIRSLIVELGDESKKLQEVFQSEFTSAWDVDVYFASERWDANAETALAVAEHMKRTAWSVLIDKLGIRKVMSAKRQAELDEQLHRGHSRRSHCETEPAPLPEIDEDTIMNVLAGMVQSADEFLQEAIEEEFRFWRPSKESAPYVRNSEFKLQRKIIRPWMVEHVRGRWRPRYCNQGHVTALDRIFHSLDGAGLPAGHYGPLTEAIMEAGPDGKFQTAFFSGKCHKNGNLHLTFLRQDLLDKFNATAGKNRLPQPGD